MLLARWPRLQQDEIEILRGRKGWISTAIEQALGSTTKETTLAIEAAETLGMTSALPKLILLAESAGSRVVRQQAGEAVLKIVEPLGSDARDERDQTSVRGPVIANLADSLRRFSMHRNEQLVEAFLICSTWSDVQLRQLLTEQGPESELICQQLYESTRVSVMALLAGFLKRRKIHEQILQAIRTRSDAAFRDTLLRVTGLEPTQVILKNLRDVGMPRCCQGGETLLSALPAECRASLVHVHVACNPDYIETLHLIAATAEHGTRDCVTAATIALSRCEVPNACSWMRAAIHLAEQEPSTTHSDETARLLQRLIRLLDHPDPGLNRNLRRVLESLHSSEMLSHFHSLRPRSRRRLGRIVMQIDPDAMNRVRDAMRHPVLTKRLDAIAMADALGAVDLLYDSFAHIAREDHQEARMRAAEAMAGATSEETLRLLEEMIALPECPVRDTAILAIRRRQQSHDLDQPLALELPSC